MTFRKTRPALCGALLLASVAAGGGAAEPSPGRPLLFHNTVFVVDGEDLVGSFALPGSAHATSLVPLPDGWIAGGTRHTPEGPDLFLYRRRGAESAELDVPAGGGPGGREYAVPLAADGRLTGLLWLEGERSNRLAVRASALTAAGWSPVEEVSQPGPGSQVALAGVVLADGSWLAVWTLVDDQGDAETVWSLRRQGAWSEPARVHEDNALHDVQPVLAAVEGGAVVAWSSFDGRDYRMRRARFDGRAWTASPHFGGAGAVNPRLIAEPDPGGGGGGVHLLYSTVAPSTWSVLALDAAGEPAAAGELARAPNDGGPVYLARGGDGALMLVWPSFAEEFDRLEAPVVLRPWPVEER